MNFTRWDIKPVYNETKTFSQRAGQKVNGLSNEVKSGE